MTQRKTLEWKIYPETDLFSPKNFSKIEQTFIVTVSSGHQICFSVSKVAESTSSAVFQAATITIKKKIIMTQTTTTDPGNQQMQIRPLSIHKGSIETKNTMSRWKRLRGLNN